MHAQEFHLDDALVAAVKLMLVQFIIKHAEDKLDNDLSLRETFLSSAAKEYK